MKRLRKKPGHFFCETWLMNYYFCLGWKWEDYVAWLDVPAMLKDPPAAGTTHLITKNGNTLGIALWTAKDSPSWILAHEALHAANFTLDTRGAVASYENDEAQAYLMTSIMRNALGGKR